MIVVAVNGLAGNTTYCDTRDGLYTLETVIVKDLIPRGQVGTRVESL